MCVCVDSLHLNLCMCVPYDHRYNSLFRVNTLMKRYYHKQHTLIFVEEGVFLLNLYTGDWCKTVEWF